MQHTSFGVVLCLWLELAALMAPASASPSFRFEKASSNHHDVSAPVSSSSPSNTSHTVDLSESDIPIDASKLCPLSFNQKDAGNERKMKHEVARLRSSKNNGFAKATIPLIFHVVAADNSVDGGHVSHHNLEQQVKILNQDFASANIEFKLEKINRISNKKWFLDVGYADKVAQEMHASTREGDAKTLNVWTTSFSKVSFTGGYAQYPWDYQRQPKDDGITIRHDFLYGSKHRLFNDGRYLTHETGHWVGLYHTFEGENCSGSGDYVDDTPAQKSPSDPGDKSCKPKDTCKDQAGQDPISNFMDYSNPGCQSAFTDGQIARMRTAIASFRDYPA